MDTEGQQQDRYRRRQRGQQGLWLVLGTSVLAFLAGLGSSSLFWISEVRVVAPDPALAQAVARTLTVPAQSSSLFYPLSRLERQAMTLPQVESVQVSRELPHYLVVGVSRRVPVAELITDHGLLLVGADGVITNLLPPGAKASHLPRFLAIPVDRPEPGGRLSAGWAQRVAEISQAVVTGALDADAQIDCSRSLDLRLTARGVEGYLGAMDNLERKVALFAALLSELRRQGGDPAYIDVRVMERPIWMPKGEVGPPAKPVAVDKAAPAATKPPRQPHSTAVPTNSGSPHP